MKQFLLKILVFSFAIIVFFIPVELLLRKIPNEYSYKKEYLDQHSEEIQIIIFGSSHGLLGINPEYFSKKTFNAAHKAQTLDYDIKIFNKYKDAFSSLEVIILPISYFSLWTKVKVDKEYCQLNDYALYYGLKADSFKDHFEMSRDNLKYSLGKIYKYYIKNKSYITCTEHGWGNNYQFADMQETGKEAARRHSVEIISKKRIKMLEENMEILNSFSDYCNQRNIKLIFVTTPTYVTYRENLNNEQLNKTFEIIKNFTNTHSNCFYFNWFDDVDFTEKDFYDADHLNETGAEKLSKKISQNINELKTLE